MIAPETTTIRQEVKDLYERILGMKTKKEPLLLVDKIEKTSIYDAPEAVALVRQERETDAGYPFPLTRQQEFELLYLLKTRKSGIVTRDELEKIIFPVHTLH